MNREAWVDAGPLGDDRMTSYVFKPKRRQPGLRAARIVLVSLATLMAANALADAAMLPNEQSVVARPIGEPIMAIVSLRDQQIAVYDDKGLIMRAPVSSGQKGRETPAGIFSVLQKDAEHYSNLYDDAYMPHMQRLTWSGIALHGGALPGYPASHGCIRMPYDFAERLFGVTKLGVRVFVAPDGAVPISIHHPALFQPKTDAAAAAASAAAVAAQGSERKLEQARLVAVKAYREWTLAMVPVRKTETLKLKADWDLATAERAIASASSPETKQQAEESKAKAAMRISELEAQLATGKAELEPKVASMTVAREAAVAAEVVAAREAATASALARALEPASVFISRKTQRLYVRQALQPVLEVPVTIQDPKRPVGTHIFTAMERRGTDFRWSAVSLFGGEESPTGSVRKGAKKATMTASAEPARAALDRITIPKDALDFIAERIWPRSSVIISDEALSPETGKETEFVVVLSGEPQGGLKNRRPAPRSTPRFEQQWSRF